MTPYTKHLRTASHRRTLQRNRRILAVGRRVDRWTRSLEERLLGIVAANRGGYDGVMGSVNRLLIGTIEDAAEVIESGLRDMWQWAWGDVTGAFIKTVPMRYWLHRLAPVTMHAEVGESDGAWRRQLLSGRSRATRLQEYDFRAENQWDRILTGKVTDAVAREIVRNAEFGEPTPQQVDAVLSATNAPDGLSAMERSKTVLPADLEQLRGIIRETMSADFSGASAVSAMKAKIAPLLDTNEGINWKAKRIARTEGVRVAEAAMRQSWEPVKDLLKGIRTFTAGDSNVRSEHQVWHDLLYVRTSDGEYRQTTRPSAPGLLPVFPAGPNCRCFATQELRDDLYQDVPPVNWGQYEKGMERVRQQEKAALSN